MLQVCKYPGICFACSTYHGALNIYCSQSHGPEHTCEMYLNDFGTTGDLLSIFRGFSRQLFAYFSFFKVMALYSICCFDMAGMPWIFCILCDLFNYFRGILGHNMTVCALGWGTVILSYQCGGVFGQVAPCQDYKFWNSDVLIVAQNSVWDSDHWKFVTISNPYPLEATFWCRNHLTWGSVQ